MRALPKLVVIAVLIAVSVWIAEQPGRVAIEWQDWRLDPSVPVLITTLLLLALVAMLVFWVLRRIVGGPGAFLRGRRERRRRAGYRALTQGMVAVAAGDAEEAQRQARKADVLLAEPPLTLLLSAQAAQLNGDEDAAHNYFSEMLKRPETEFLGLRGLLTQALRKGDDATALRLAERAHALRPKTPWVLSNLLELQVRAGAWNEAQ
ncbi:MAG: heme biosynthesis protein HemY, partial [Alphaproteobacteria bacterium]|nr:heme biosynthesis protein HemY [Alphaproteobacteria bacterium]